MKAITSIEELMQRSIDGAISAEEAELLDNHLEKHPADAQRLEAMRRQTSLLAQSVPTPPRAHLRDLTARARKAPNPSLRLAASIAILVVGVGIGFSLPRSAEPATTDLANFATQARAAHALYVSEVLHPVEVGASEKDHLQAWLSNRLGAPIIAPQLGQTGYSLIGGRLLPAGERASALFMYENATGDRLSLVATHSDSTKSQSFRFEESNGYLVVFWQDGPWQYSVVGDLSHDPLNEVAREIHGQMI